MNKVILIGRLTRDPEVRVSTGEGSQSRASYTLAVDRRRGRNAQAGEQTADFIRCTAWGYNADFAEKYLRKGTKILVQGRIQTGSYTNKDGQTVYTTDVIVDEHEFVESKNAAGGSSFDGGNAFGGDGFGGQASQPSGAADGFMPIPDGIDEELPFA